MPRATLMPVLVLLALSACFLAVAAGAETGADWTSLRGPYGDSSADADWPETPRLEVLWKVPLGSGYSGVVTSGGRLITAWAEGGRDVVGAFDAATGERGWTLDLGAMYPGHDGSHDGPLATPLVADERIYAISGSGRLIAANLDGEEAWRLELGELGEAPFYGYASSPLIVDGTLVVQAPLEDGSAAIGLDPATGERRWTAAKDTVNYQSPAVVRVDGAEQVVLAGDKTLFGLDPNDGSILWEHPYGVERGTMSIHPTPVAGGVLVRPGSLGGVLLTVDASGDAPSVETVWANHVLQRSYVVPVAAGDCIFGYKRAFLHCLDPETGETRWGSRPPGDGFLAAADDRLVVLTKRGKLHLVEATAAEFRPQAELELFDADTWTAPIVADGVIYARNTAELAAVAVRSAERRAEAAWPGTELPAESTFGTFLRGLETSSNRQAAVESYLENQTTFPIVEGDWVHFVYRSEETSVGIESDLSGDRIQPEMNPVPGTDLFYWSFEAPRDAWVAYRFAPGMGDEVVDPHNAAVTRRDDAEFSHFAMPDWPRPAWADAEPPARGQMMVVEVDRPEPPADAPQPPRPEGAEPPGPRTVTLFVPPGADGAAEPLPVVYVFFGDAMLEHGSIDRPIRALVGERTRDAVVALVQGLAPGEGDSFGGFAAHADHFFSSVVPAVEAKLPMSSARGDRAYVGMGFGGTVAIRTALDPRSQAGRVVAIQPFMMEGMQSQVMEAVETRGEAPKPTFWVETSTLDLRAEHEGWDVGLHAQELVEELRALGYQIRTTRTNNGFGWEGWASRTDDALVWSLQASAATR
ncbi:MAG: PQQ-binding-like beta-propeller repeat protein [Acidobacteriota bacterium]